LIAAVNPTLPVLATSVAVVGAAEAGGAKTGGRGGDR